MTADWSLVARGFSLFPIMADTKRPALEWEPYQTRLPTSAELDAWSRGDWNTGVATGAVSGVVVLDLDNLDAWSRALARGLPDTLTIKTPRGWHYYFQHPGWHVSNRAHIRDVPLPGETKGTRNDGWDIRGDGGYVLGPGSRFIPDPAEAEAGKVAGTYTVESDLPPAPLPQWLFDMLLPRAPVAPVAPRREADETSAYGRRAMYDELVDIRDAVPGTVNDQINASTFAIAQLVAGGEIRADEAYESIMECLAYRALDGEEKATGTVQRAWDAGLENPRAAPPSVDPAAAFGTRGGPPQPTAAPDSPEAPAPAAATNDEQPPELFGVKIYAEELPRYFQGCTYVQALDKVFVTASGDLLGKSQFDTLYGGREFFSRYEENTKLQTSAWDAFRLNQLWRPPIAHDLCFRPEREPGGLIDVEGRWLLNTYVPVRIDRMAGDASPFTGLLEKMLPDAGDREILTNYMAAMVQNPGAKFQWWPVLQGVEGNGKTLLLTVLTAAIGERYTHLVNPEAMRKTGNQFNEWIEGHLFVGIEEFYVEGSQRDFLNSFKTTVTNLRMPLEGKGIRQRTGDNRANGMILTNYADAIPLTVDMRRYAIFYTAQQHVVDLSRDGMDGLYFPRLWDWLRAGGFAIVSDYLHTFPVSDEWRTRMFQRAPKTSSNAAALLSSRGLIEDEVAELVAQDAPGFAGGWISSTWLDKLLLGLRKSMSYPRRKQLLEGMGYVQHPGLNDGRATVAVHPDGKKSRLYVTKGHLSLNLTTPAAVCEAYEKAQGTAAASAAFGARV